MHSTTQQTQFTESQLYDALCALVGATREPAKVRTALKKLKDTSDSTYSSIENFPGEFLKKNKNSYFVDPKSLRLSLDLNEREIEERCDAIAKSFQNWNNAGRKVSELRKEVIYMTPKSTRAIILNCILEPGNKSTETVPAEGNTLNSAWNSSKLELRLNPRLVKILMGGYVVDTDTYRGEDSAASILSSSILKRALAVVKGMTPEEWKECQKQAIPLGLNNSLRGPTKDIPDAADAEVTYRTWNETKILPNKEELKFWHKSLVSVAVWVKTCYSPPKQKAPKVQTEKPVAKRHMLKGEYDAEKVLLWVTKPIEDDVLGTGEKSIIGFLYKDYTDVVDKKSAKSQTVSVQQVVEWVKKDKCAFRTPIYPVSRRPTVVTEDEVSKIDPACFFRREKNEIVMIHELLTRDVSKHVSKVLTKAYQGKIDEYRLAYEKETAERKEKKSNDS